MNKREHWALVWFLTQPLLTNTALYPLCSSSLVEERKLTFSKHLPSVFTYSIIFNFANVLWSRHSFFTFYRQGTWGSEKLSNLSEVIILASDRIRIPNQVFTLHEKHHLHCRILYRNQMRSLEHLIAVSMAGNYRFCTPTWIHQGKEIVTSLCINQKEKLF